MDFSAILKGALVENWKAVLSEAWSIKFIIASAVFSGIEAGLPVFQRIVEPLNIIPPGVFTILALITTALAGIARVLAQPNSSLK